MEGQILTVGDLIELNRIGYTFEINDGHIAGVILPNKNLKEQKNE